MKKPLILVFFAAAGLSLAACESQRTTGAGETTTTTERVTTDTPTGTATPATASPETNTGQTDTGELSAEAAASGTFVSDADFAAKAAESGMAEVKFGNLADRKAVRPEVKQFGIQMAQDHTRANSLLIRLAQRRKWPTPEDMDVEHQQAYSRLATVMSDEFDQAYIAQMVKDHELAVAMFQQASAQATDPELKAFAANTLPALKMHLGMARDLQKKIEASR